MANSFLNYLSPISNLPPMFGGGNKSKGNKGAEGYSEVSTFSPEQQQLFSQFAQLLGPLLGQSGGYLQDLLGGSEESFNRFAAPYQRQFQEQIVPELAEQFAGVGALSSSGFQQALGQAGAGLSERLASLKEGLRSQIAPQIFSNLQQLLGQNTKAFLKQDLPWWQQGLVGFGGGLGEGLGLALGGGLTGGIGALGGALSKMGQQKGAAAGPYGGGASYNPYTGYQGNSFIG